MSFRVTILGSSAAQPTLTKHHSAHALNVHEQFYLVDCGEGTQNRLIECGIHPMKINAIFISHLHGDHVYGIFPLISTLGLMGRKTPLKIFAPKPFAEIMENHFRYFDTGLQFEIELTEIYAREHTMIYQNKVMEVWTIPLRHRVPSAGYLFKEKTPALNVDKFKIERYGLDIYQIVAAKRGEDIILGDGTVIPNDDVAYLPYEPRSYAYCSDTQYSGKVASIVKSCDLLYHEATFADKDKALAKQTGHSTAAQAAKVAATAEVGRLLIGHFSTRYKDEQILVDEARAVFPNTDAAHEGETYEIKGTI